MKKSDKRTVNETPEEELHGITSLALLMPLYPKIGVHSAHKKQDFKERLANVKHAGLELWAKENLSENMVALRSKTLKKVGLNRVHVTEHPNKMLIKRGQKYKRKNRKHLISNACGFLQCPK